MGRKGTKERYCKETRNESENENKGERGRKREQEREEGEGEAETEAKAKESWDCDDLKGIREDFKKDPESLRGVWSCRKNM